MLKTIPSDGNLYIVHHPQRGRCVMANRAFQAGEAITMSPVVEVAYATIENTVLRDYSMYWNDEVDCICFGLINILNHSTAQTNTTIERDFVLKQMTLFATRDIAAGDELFIDYDCELWFDDSQDHAGKVSSAE